MDKGYQPRPDELEAKGHLIHAVRMIHMFDAALSMLGPDTETLCEILRELGKRHIGYGVKVRHHGSDVLGSQCIRQILLPSHSTMCAAAALLSVHGARGGIRPV